MYRRREVECNCGWCATELHFALLEGKPTVQFLGCVCMFFAFIEIWAGGAAYSISSSQEEAAGAWWGGVVLFLAGLFGVIRSFQCCKCFKIIGLILSMLAVVITFAGLVVDAVAWARVGTIQTCVNRDYKPFGVINNDTVLSSAVCMESHSKTKYTITGSKETKPYECACVTKKEQGTFPTDTFDCDHLLPFYDNCPQAFLDYPTIQACIINVPEVYEATGNNATGFRLSSRFCALKNNISSGVFNGCACVENDFMSAYFDGSITWDSKCEMYALNKHTDNCDQIVTELPAALEGSVAGITLCFLCSVVYFLAMTRVSFFPSCCVFSPKQVLPLNGPEGAGGGLTITDEQRMIDEAMKATGLRKEKPPEFVLTDPAEIAQYKKDQKEANPLYLAWYHHAGATKK